jgi:hypothetical protein
MTRRRQKFVNTPKTREEEPCVFVPLFLLLATPPLSPTTHEPLPHHVSLKQESQPTCVDPRDGGPRRRRGLSRQRAPSKQPSTSYPCTKARPAPQQRPGQARKGLAAIFIFIGSHDRAPIAPSGGPNREPDAERCQGGIPFRRTGGRTRKVLERVWVACLAAVCGRSGRHILMHILHTQWICCRLGVSFSFLWRWLSPIAHTGVACCLASLPLNRHPFISPQPA